MIYSLLKSEQWHPSHCQLLLSISTTPITPLLDVLLFNLLAFFFWLLSSIYFYTTSLHMIFCVHLLLIVCVASIPYYSYLSCFLASSHLDLVQTALVNDQQPELKNMPPQPNVQDSALQPPRTHTSIALGHTYKPLNILWRPERNKTTPTRTLLGLEHFKMHW